MLFTLKRPKSKRFYFVTPNTRINNENLFKCILLFITTYYKYIFMRLGTIFNLVVGFFVFIGHLLLAFRIYFIRKLIWSRGRLGRPLASLSIMVVAFTVFLFGEVLNSSKLVNSQEVNPAYLVSVVDIIPRKNIVTTTLPENRKRTEPLVYNVEPGDNLSIIGNKFKVSTDALSYVNNLSDNSYLKVGQEIVIPPISGLVHTVKSGDTLQLIAEKYDVAAQAIADFNYILDTSKLAVGTELLVPGAKVPRIEVPVIPSYISTSRPIIDTSASKGWGFWPSSVRIITQYYSWYHNGLDIACPIGAAMPPLYASSGGTVIRSGWDPWGLGLHVRIDHGNGYETVYGHMSRIDVSYGEKVAKGEVIGYMGSTGNSSGPHVHFMVRYNGTAQNPLNYIN